MMILFMIFAFSRNKDLKNFKMMVNPPPYQANFTSVLFYGFYTEYSDKNGGVMSYNASSQTINIQDCLFGFSGVGRRNGDALYLTINTINISRTCRYDLECQYPNSASYGRGVFAYINPYTSDSNGTVDLDTLALRICAPPLTDRRFDQTSAWQ